MAKVEIHTLNVYIGTQPPPQAATAAGQSASAGGLEQALAHVARLMGSGDLAGRLAGLVQGVASGSMSPSDVAAAVAEAVGQFADPPVGGPLDDENAAHGPGERVQSSDDWRDDMSIMGDAPAVAATDTPAVDHDDEDEREDESDGEAEHEDGPADAEFAPPTLADFAAGIEDEGEDEPGPGFSPMAAVEHAAAEGIVHDDLPPLTREDRLAMATAGTGLVQGLEPYRWRMLAATVVEAMEQAGETAAGRIPGQPDAVQETAERVVRLATDQLTWRAWAGSPSDEVVQVQVERERPAAAVLDLALAMQPATDGPPSDQSAADRLDEFLTSLSGTAGTPLADLASRVRVWRESHAVAQWLASMGAALAERARELPAQGPERTVSVGRAWLEGVQPAAV